MSVNTSSETSRVATAARYGLAAGAIAFSILVVIALLLTPSDLAGEEGREYVEAFSRHQDGYPLAAWLWALAWFLSVPAVLAVGRVARSRAPALGLAGLILAFFFVIDVAVDTDDVIYAGLEAGLDVDTITTLVDSIETNLPSSILGFTFFLGLLGLILLGVAIVRGKSAPVWAGIALIVGPVAIPLSFFSGVVAALVVAWAVLGVGFVGCALVLTRQPIPGPADVPA